MKNEPECWTCQSFSSSPGEKLCSRFRFLIPERGSTLFICKEFQHYADPTIELRFGFKDYLQENLLYAYHFMDTQPPAVFSRFSELTRSGEPD
jgi:hypothetical protein